MSDSQNSQDSGSDSAAIRALSALRSLNQLDLQPSPYLVARIKAGLMSDMNRVSARGWLRYFWPAVSAALACALVVVLSARSEHPNEEIASYVVGQDYLIRVDIRSVHQTDVAYAEIVLQDENLQFSSQQFADVKELRKLVIEWQQLTDKQYLPIVVQGLKAGTSQVTVNFYDKNNNVILTKEMPLSFKGKNI